MVRDLARRLFNGMQVHAYSILDEGAQTVVNNMIDMAGVHAIYPTANYIRERHPYPSGDLPHDPKRKSTFSEGGVYFEPHAEHYKDTEIKIARTPEEGLKDNDIIKSVVEAAESRGLRVLPWVVALNDPIITSLNPRHMMVDYEGRRISNWLCPNNEEVRKFVGALAEDLLSNYNVQGIFLDRIRFPEWGGQGEGFGAVLTCFCPQCHERAKTLGIDLERIRSRIRSLLTGIERTLSDFLTFKRGCLDLVKLIIDEPDVAEWIKFRHIAIRDLVEDVKTRVKKTSPSAEFSLDIWPPSYSWLLGQDYKKLAESCDSMKYFTYHKLGGGADVSAVIKEFSKTYPSLAPEELLSLFYRIFGFDGPSTLKEFKEGGLSPNFVGDETMKAVSDVKGSVKVYAGIQIWSVREEEIVEAMQKAAKAKADGFIHLCYDWATFQNLEAIGRIMKRIV